MVGFACEGVGQLIVAHLHGEPTACSLEASRLSTWLFSTPIGELDLLARSHALGDLAVALRTHLTNAGEVAVLLAPAGMTALQATVDSRQTPRRPVKRCSRYRSAPLSRTILQSACSALPRPPAAMDPMRET